MSAAKRKRRRAPSGAKRKQRRPRAQSGELPAFEQVFRAVVRIPRGKVATYGQISELIERRLTPIGVGWALRTAPESVPWQRVVNARGGISTDAENPGLQRALLEREGVRFGKDGSIDLGRYGWRAGRS